MVAKYIVHMHITPELKAYWFIITISSTDISAKLK